MNRGRLRWALLAGVLAAVLVAGVATAATRNGPWHGKRTQPGPVPAARPGVAAAGPSPTGPSVSPSGATPGPSAPVQAPAPVSPPVPVGTPVYPEAFGANGDDGVDDTAALQRAFDSLDATRTLVIAAGRTYRHNAVLHLRRADARVMGPGTILATEEAQEAVFIEQDRVTLYGGLVLKIDETTRRFSTHQSCKLRIAGRVDTVIDGVTIDGAGGAGIFVGDGASRFTIRDVRVFNTRADGIHITNGSHDGTVVRPLVSGQGDDGVAVVSYADQPVICRNITVDAPVVRNQYHGRGITVVGGDNIEYRNIRVESTTSAGVYIAAEGNPYFTYGPSRIRVLGGTVLRGNTLREVGHGAVLVYSGHDGYRAGDILIDGLQIIDTRADAPSVVGVRGQATTFSGIRLTNLAISGTHPRSIGAFPALPQGMSRDEYPIETEGWTLDGAPYTPPHP